MNTKFLTLIFAAPLISAAVGFWFLGAGDLFSQASTMNLKDIPTVNIVLAACVPVVALFGLLSRWNDSKKNHCE